MAEIERMLKRLKLAPLLLPVLLFVGAGVGRLTSDSLEVPEGRSVRMSDAPSRIQLDVLSRFLDNMVSARTEGTETEEYIALYQDHVAPVERSLIKRRVPPEDARRMAWAIVENSRERELDPATVLAVLLIESVGDPNATSFVGARGLMQVMPMHAGRWRGCGMDMYDIEENICYGTSILAWYLRIMRGDERRALLGYNGCVRGTNTRDCFRYPDKVDRIRSGILAEWRTRAAGPTAAMP
ncbi:MAG TPA: lytic transglycosylase domain-containing protein [Longimicrobiales bacterium]|nr:lytic transglycosylase domain-containing protein [Longimicrobiales bacterium]